MAWKFLIGVAVALRLSARAAAIQMEKMTTIPENWHSVGVANDTASITLHVGLQLSNLDSLPSKILAVSTPGGAQYGQHLSKDEVDTIFAPSAQTTDAVSVWLAKYNITDTFNHGHWLSFKTSVGKANSLLNTTFTNFADSNGNVKMRTAQYHVPEDVAEHIDLITPTVYLSALEGSTSIPQHGAVPFGAKREPYQFQRRASAFSSERSILAAEGYNKSLLHNCSAVITPDCLRQMYNVGNYTPDASAGSRVGFGSFLGETASVSDLHKFQDIFGIPQSNLTIETSNGASDLEAGGYEANLDSQYLNAMSHPLPITEFIVNGTSYAIPDAYQSGPDDQNEPWVPYYWYLLSRSNEEIPQVISNSYGEGEQTVPYRYAKRVCNMIGFLGLRGVTVLESSGDDGIGAACRTNDGTNRTAFTPEFPASCPYVTAVGGTQAYPQEEAWTGSGGGFSNYFASPFYQMDDVSDYLTNGISEETKQYYGPFFNATGRAYPDVSAHSAAPYLAIIASGNASGIGGTSASCPIFAGLVAMLNDARIRAGKPVMGFLNPWLYAVGKYGMNDITAGGSIGCAGQNTHNTSMPDAGYIPFASWNATKGWDPVTGLGTPNFQYMLNLALEFY